MRGARPRSCSVAGSVSGSLIQDLKAGHLLGGTPWKMQVVEIIAVVLLAFFLMGPIIALHESEAATGGIGGRNLPAPQAALMAQLAKGIVDSVLFFKVHAALPKRPVEIARQLLLINNHVPPRPH